MATPAQVMVAALSSPVTATLVGGATMNLVSTVPTLGSGPEGLLGLGEGGGQQGQGHDGLGAGRAWHRKTSIGGGVRAGRLGVGTVIGPV